MADQYIHSLTDLWNSGATTYYAIKMNVTDTASAADSKLIDLQVGGVTQFSVGKVGDVVATGTVTVADATAAAHALNRQTGDARYILAADLPWKEIFYGDLASASNHSFTDLGAYRRLRIKGFLIPATNAVAIGLRYSINNGVSFDSSNSYYEFFETRTSAAPATLDAGGSSTSRVPFNSSGVDNTRGVSFSLEISEFNQARICPSEMSSVYRDSSNVVRLARSYIEYSGTTARDAIQIAAGSGNVSGWALIEGLEG